MTKHPGLSGVGGLTASGRWHNAGRRVIYASEHPALSMLEVLAHLRAQPGEIPTDYRMTAIEVPASCIGALRQELPNGWQANLQATRALGDRWLARGGVLAVAVPSALLAHATNYLINPAHPQARALLGQVLVEPAWIDSRVLAVKQP